VASQVWAAADQVADASSHIRAQPPPRVSPRRASAAGDVRRHAEVRECRPLNVGEPVGVGEDAQPGRLIHALAGGPHIRRRARGPSASRCCRRPAAGWSGRRGRSRSVGRGRPGPTFCGYVEVRDEFGDHGVPGSRCSPVLPPDRAGRGGRKPAIRRVPRETRCSRRSNRPTLASRSLSRASGSADRRPLAGQVASTSRPARSRPR